MRMRMTNQERQKIMRQLEKQEAEADACLHLINGDTKEEKAHCS